MSREAMDASIKRTFERILELRRSKGEEYDDGKNSLDNFCRAAADADLTPETILVVFAGKHWRSICDYVKDLEKKRERSRTEPIEDRIDDLITYLCLLKGMMETRNGPRVNKIS